MLEKPPKVAANKKLFRDYSDFNAENELAAIKKCILSCHRHIFGRFWASDQLDDFALEVFLRLWDRDFYRGFDSNRGRYEAYLQESVHNVIIDIIRLKNVRDSRNTLSLNAPLSVDSDSGGELLDMVVDTTNQDVTEVICANELQNRMRARVVELDSAGSALPGFSYGVIFDALVTGTLEDLTKHYPYGKRVLATYVSKLRSELACVCQEYA
jgi:DNA-directed RNA polymerase specialized sigma24 family protein